jgi:hypothetical protein
MFLRSLKAPIIITAKWRQLRPTGLACGQIVQFRHFGVADKFMNIAQDKMADSKGYSFKTLLIISTLVFLNRFPCFSLFRSEKQFAVVLDLMTKNKKWTYRLWQQTIKNQLSSWTMYVPGVGSTPEMQEFKNFDAIMATMSPRELDNLDELNGEAKNRLAKNSGKTIDEINRLVHCFKQSMVVSNWLQTKKENREKLPKSEQELLQMQERDGSRVRNIFMKM